MNCMHYVENRGPYLKRHQKQDKRPPARGTYFEAAYDAGCSPSPVVLPGPLLRFEKLRALAVSGREEWVYCAGTMRSFAVRRAPDSDMKHRVRPMLSPQSYSTLQAARVFYSLQAPGPTRTSIRDPKLQL